LIDGAIFDSKAAKVCTLKGNWSTSVMIYFDSNEQGQDLFDVNRATEYLKIVSPIPEQNPMESQRLWDPIKRALEVKDFKKADFEKQKSESIQRKYLKKHPSPQPYLFSAGNKQSENHHQNHDQLNNYLFREDLLEYDKNQIRQTMNAWIPAYLQNE